MTLGERLKQLREENGLTLDDVAKAVGLTRPTIYRYETGEITNVPPNTVHALANYFHVTRPYLMGWTDQREINPAENLDTVAENLRSPAGQIVSSENNSVYWHATYNKETDCVTAATQAYRALVKFGIERTPIYPQQILQKSQYSTVVSFENARELDDILLYSDLHMARTPNDLVMVCNYVDEDKEHYLFAVNRNAPMGHLKLALAVELGHIYLGHASFLRGAGKKQKEAECFAMHMEFPRPMIKLLRERGVRLTKEVFSRVFGDCEWCLDSLLNAEPVRVSPELNRLVKEQFTPYVDTLERAGIFKIPHRGEVLDLSKYMNGYEE